MADQADVITMNQIVGVLITAGGFVIAAGGGILIYLLKKRDDRIDKHDGSFETVHKRIDDGEKEMLKQQLKAAEIYATKESMRGLFHETQQANRDMSARLEKQIDETKEEIRDTKNQISHMQTTIMTELSKKT